MPIDSDHSRAETAQLNKRFRAIEIQAHVVPTSTLWSTKVPSTTDILCALPCSTILLNRMFSMYALILITLSLHPLFTVPLRSRKIY